METTEIIPTEAKTSIANIEQMFSNFDNYAIECHGDLETAADWLVTARECRQQLEEKRKSMTKPLDESKKRIMDFFRRPLEVIEKAEGSIKRAVAGWQAEQERIREDHNRRIAEQARLEAERAAKDLAAKAAEAAAWGDDEAAETILQEAPAVVAPPPLIKEQKSPVDGMTLRDNWQGVIVNFETFARWCVEHGEFSLLAVDQRALNYRAKGCKGKTEIPGVAWSNERTVVARS